MNAACMLYAAASLLGAFTYRPDGGAGLFFYDSAAGSREPFVNLMNPVSLPFQKGAFFSTRAENPYGIRGLASYFAAAGYSSDGAGASAAWTRFGTPEYTEDRAFLSAGKSAGPLSIGIRTHADRVKLSLCGFSQTRTAMDADSAMRLDPLSFLSLGCVQQNIYAVFSRTQREILYPETALGAALFPARGITLSWNYNRTYYGGVNSLSCSVALLPQLRIGAGYSRETQRYALQSELLVKGVLVSYAFSYHPSLGVTHSAGVSWSPGCKGFPAVDSSCQAFPATENERKTVVDIANCSAEALAEASGISDEMASRIVRSRELFGCVSEKTLYQMGLSPSERSSVMDHADGIITEREEKEAALAKKEQEWERRKNAPKKKAKDVFLRLVDAGVSPPKALKAAQIAKRAGGSFADEISRSGDFSTDEKRRIIAVCAGQ